jgi:hypothetical protein
LRGVQVCAWAAPANTKTNAKTAEVMADVRSSFKRQSPFLLAIGKTDGPQATTTLYVFSPLE